MKLFDKTIKMKGRFFISLQNWEQKEVSSFNSFIGTAEADRADIVYLLYNFDLDSLSSEISLAFCILSCSVAIKFKSKYLDGMKTSPNKLGANRIL